MKLKNITPKNIDITKNKYNHYLLPSYVCGYDPENKSKTIIIIIMLLLWKFFTSSLAYGFPLEFEWQQVSSSLKDFSQYSGRS